MTNLCFTRSVHGKYKVSEEKNKSLNLTIVWGRRKICIWSYLHKILYRILIRTLISTISLNRETLRNKNSLNKLKQESFTLRLPCRTKISHQHETQRTNHEIRIVIHERFIKRTRWKDRGIKIRYESSWKENTNSYPTSDKQVEKELRIPAAKKLSIDSFRIIRHTPINTQRSKKNS